MKVEEIEVGGVYGDADTAYRIDAIENGRITGTPIRAKHFPKNTVGRQRHNFATVGDFARWAKQRFE